MIRSLLTIAMIAAAALCAAGQTDRYSQRPNFSGVWVPERPSTGNVSDMVWLITHKGVEVKIKKTFRYNGQPKANLFTVYTDYRDPADLDAVLDRNEPTKLVSIRELKKGRAAESSQTRLQDGESPVYWLATIELSADGTKLTIKTTKYVMSGLSPEARNESSDEHVLLRKNWGSDLKTPSSYMP